MRSTQPRIISYKNPLFYKIYNHIRYIKNYVRVCPTEINKLYKVLGRNASILLFRLFVISPSFNFSNLGLPLGPSLLSVQFWKCPSPLKSNYIKQLIFFTLFLHALLVLIFFFFVNPNLIVYFLLTFFIRNFWLLTFLTFWINCFFLFTHSSLCYLCQLLNFKIWCSKGWQKPNGHTTSNPRRFDVGITSIRRRPNFDEFPRHFRILFRCNIDGRKIHVVSTYFLRCSFTGRKIYVVSMYFYRCNFAGRKIHIAST